MEGNKIYSSCTNRCEAVYHSAGYCRCLCITGTRYCIGGTGAVVFALFYLPFYLPFLRPIFILTITLFGSLFQPHILPMLKRGETELKLEGSEMTLEVS